MFPPWVNEAIAVAITCFDVARSSDDRPRRLGTITGHQTAALEYRPRIRRIVAAWWWDASLLTAAADANLQLIKIVTSKLPFDWGSKVESALRIFGADRALLLIEGVAIAKVVMLGFAYPFRRRR
jgi:hypothetical protein